MTTFFSLENLGLESDSATMLDDWLTQMQAQYPGYVPADGNLEYLQAQIFTSWAADLAQMASSGATELFKQYGQKLIKLAPTQGVAASAVVSVTATSTGDAVTYTLPAASEFNLDSYGFTSLADVTIASGASQSVTVVAVESSVDYNGAGAGGIVELLTQLDWVTNVSLVASASGGTAPEDDDAYLARLANYLTMLTPRPVIPNDFSNLAVDMFTPLSGTDQEAIGRAVAIDGYNPGQSTFTVTTVSGNPAVTITTGPGPTVWPTPTAAVSGTNIPVSSYIAASPAPTVSGFSLVNASGTPVNASGSGSGITATVAGTLGAVTGGTLGNERTVAICATQADGTALNNDTLFGIGGSPSAVVADSSQWGLAGWLASMREINYKIFAVSPNYIPIYVTVSVHPLTGWASADVQTSVQSVLLSFLSPGNWGLQIVDVANWQNYPTIYASKLTATIQGAPGVDYLSTLKFGTAGTPTNTADLRLTGAIPLPTSTTITIPTSAITVI